MYIYIMYMVWVFTNQLNKDFECIVEFEVQEKSKSPVTKTFPEITIFDDEQVLYLLFTFFN